MYAPPAPHTADAARHTTWTTPATTHAARDARRWARTTLACWHATAAADAVDVLITELVTNVLDHTDSHHVTCALCDATDHLLLEVADSGDPAPSLPAPGPPPDDAEHGRGLLLVDAIADTWGTTPADNGTHVVWATVRTSPNAEEAAAPPSSRPAAEGTPTPAAEQSGSRGGTGQQPRRELLHA
jgi:serine/threonine-protein kinase RsbW